MSLNCPYCGAEISPKATACPECGSDESTGWSERACADNLNLPNGEFDYDEFVKEEFGGAAKPRGVGWFWWSVGVIVLLLFLLWTIR